MAIANPLLLILGSFFVAIPIVIHLVMRRKPKHLIFPALRFIKERRETNRRQLQLRHWLLLMLRCLAVFALAAALAGPSVASALVGNWLIIGVMFVVLIVVVLITAITWFQRKSRLLSGILTGISAALAVLFVAFVFTTLIRGSNINIGNRQAPVAAVLVIDTSPRMQYRQANQTRLEQAQEIGQWLIKQLPGSSRVSVVDSSIGEPFFSVDIAAARKRIDVLQTTYVTQTLITSVDKAVRLLRDSEQRKEVYILTDMTEAAWEGDTGEALKRRLEKETNVSLYVIDVGVVKPENFALGEVQLVAESIPKNGKLQLATDLRCLGPGGSRTVELHLEKPDLTKPVMLDGKLQLPQQEWVRSATCQVDENSSQQVEFNLTGLELGVHQGYVRVIGEDGLAIDDKRYFTIAVKDAWPVLVVAPKGGTTKTFKETLAPYTQRETGNASYVCTEIQPSNLLNEDLSDYAAIALLDPEPMAPLVWEKLADFAAAGGGVAIFLGHNARDDASFNGEQPQRLLPGRLAPIVGRSDGDLFLATPNSFDHPISAAFRPIASSIPWRDFPIYRYWVFDSKSPDTNVVLGFGNNRPALIDRAVGSGRVLTMATPISDPSQPEGRRRWNDLLLGRPLPYFIIVEEAFAYLVENSTTKLNYAPGEKATLANDEEKYPKKYDLFMPTGSPQPVSSQDNRLLIPSTKTPGAYRLRGSRGGPVVRGFCVNLSPQATDLKRTDAKRLDELLGAKRYTLARNREEIDRGQGEARVGREFYPWLITVLVVVLALEYMMANRFYQKEE